ncbi:hypothetical protein C8R45DRAFT_1003382 [Mycena sanguinolenta]|nr:hypothetical protein C8R45DRAFT_1003382 [Mycena sanguinolenta]
MPKAKMRLTLKKQSKKGTIALGHDKNAPTAAQWEQLPRYQIFQVSDEDGVSYDFAIDNFARVLPNGREVGDPDLQSHDYWICKIVDVRARNEHDVWALVEWLYSASDAARINKGFDGSHCGKYERLQSNHRDCVSSNCFDGLARVKQFDPTSLDQEKISGDEFYCRYTVNTTNKSISPTPTPTCICGCLYNPSDPALKSVMHLCLQPSCRKYYHRGCVTPTRTSTPYERIHFIMTDPDTGESVRLPLNESASAEPPKKRRRASGIATDTPSTLPAIGDLLATFPPALLRAAAQPIMRGGMFGVVGNVAAVVAARRIVRDALQEGTTADGWEERMLEGWEGAMAPGWDTEEIVLGGVAVGTSAAAVDASASANGSVKIKVSSRGSTNSKGPKGKGKVKGNSTVLQCPGCGEAI